MAHTCPDCGCLCHCGGDIDDVDFGDDCVEADLCSHFETPDCLAQFEREDEQLPQHSSPQEKS